MKKMNSQKGFTLIELLIVIAIIAVLAVAFLPTLLGAPAKGRDTSRIATLQKIQKVLVNANLEGHSYPGTQCVIKDFGKDVSFATKTDDAYYLTSFGGALPVDPQAGNTVKTKGISAGCDTAFAYEKAPATGYAFGLYAKLERQASANASCAALVTNPVDLTTKATADTDACYAVLTQ